MAGAKLSTAGLVSGMERAEKQKKASQGEAFYNLPYNCGTGCMESSFSKGWGGGGINHAVVAVTEYVQTPLLQSSGGKGEVGQGQGMTRRLRRRGAIRVPKAEVLGLHEAILGLVRVRVVPDVKGTMDYVAESRYIHREGARGETIGSGRGVLIGTRFMPIPQYKYSNHISSHVH